MDEMKLKLSTSFMRKMVAKLLSRVIRKKFGCEVNIELNELVVEYIDGRASIQLSAGADMDGDEFKRLIKEFNED